MSDQKLSETELAEEIGKIVIFLNKDLSREKFNYLDEKTYLQIINAALAIKIGIEGANIINFLTSKNEEKLIGIMTIMKEVSDNIFERLNLKHLESALSSKETDISSMPDDHFYRA